REKEGRKDWKYLFVTLAYSPQLQSWVDLLIELPNRFQGIYLLPVESENFIHRLRESIIGKKLKKGKAEAGEPQWQLLVAHNKVGGFRQIVLKNGKLIFARLAQPIGDSQPEVIAGSIEQEISVTVEYLKRLGYSDDQGLELYVITSEQIKASIDAHNLNAAVTHVMTPFEVSERIGFTQVSDPSDRYADIVMAAAFAQDKKHLLKLETKEGKRLSQFYGGLMAVKAGGALVTVGALAMAAWLLLQIPGMHSDIADIKVEAEAEKRKLAAVKELEKELPDNLDYITDMVAIYKRLSQLGLQPLDALKRYRESIQDVNVLLTYFGWDNQDPLLSRSSSGDGSRGSGKQRDNTGQSQKGDEFAVAEDTLKLTIRLDMYETKQGSEAFALTAMKFQQQMQQQFSEYNITLKSELPGVQDDEDLEIGSTDDALDPLVEEDFYSLEYEISGPKAPAEDASGTGNTPQQTKGGKNQPGKGRGGRG
ncbi:MAG: hypothetical protein ACPG80_02965, partial [Rickettsiales bacterium]